MREFQHAVRAEAPAAETGVRVDVVPVGLGPTAVRYAGALVLEPSVGRAIQISMLGAVLDFDPFLEAPCAELCLAREGVGPRRSTQDSLGCSETPEKAGLFQLSERGLGSCKQLSLA